MVRITLLNALLGGLLGLFLGAVGVTYREPRFWLFIVLFSVALGVFELIVETVKDGHRQ